jgi:hypothetical protein
MAVSATHYFVLRDMYQQGLLPQKAAVLELGEANWYNHVPPEGIANDIAALVADPVRRDALTARLKSVLDEHSPNYLFDVVKLCYAFFFDAVEVQAVDFNGTALAQRQDLNEPLRLNRKFDVIFNHGTAEHIFNIGQVFKTMHEYTVPGGLMIHESPFTGWIDHGFYSVQPTLFFDLAAANGYAIVGMFLQELTTKTIRQIRSRQDIINATEANLWPPNSMWMVVLKKGQEELPFVVPIQGVYGGTLSSEGLQAWRELR